MGEEALKRGLLLGQVIRAAVQLQAALEQALQASQSGLTPLGIEVLRLLSERGPTTRAGLSRLLGLQPQTLGRTVAHLFRGRLIAKDAARGRREVFLTVTSDGHTQLGAALALLEAQQELWFKGVPSRERTLVSSILAFGAEGVQWEALRRWHPLYRGAKL
jgi:DNA-binding MarR family transcriptional regulator